MTALRSSRNPRRLASAAVLIAAAVCAARGARAALSPGNIPPADQQAIEQVLRDRAAELMSEKNSDGVPFKRGVWSKTFRKVDASTYETTFHMDTASADRLTTERQLLTVKKDASGRWAVASAETKDTYDRLVRERLGAEKFYAFDKLSFDRDGLKITGGAGFLAKDFLDGKTSGFAVAADGLAYSYDPPKDLDYYQIHRQVMLKKFPAELIFEPDYFAIDCSPSACGELETALFSGLKEVQLAEVSPKLNKVYEESKKDYVDRLKQTAFTGFRLPTEPDRNRFFVAIRRKGGAEHWIWLSEDNYQPREVSFGISNHGPVYSYYSGATRQAGIDPAQLERRDDIDARDFDLYRLHGKVELAVDDAETVAGDLTYGITIRRPLRELEFQIARHATAGSETQNLKNPRMFVHSITDGDGNELTWVKLGSSGGIIVLPQQVETGQQVTIRMQFESQDSLYKLNPTYSEVDREGWLPLVRVGDKIPDFDLTITVPEKYTTLGVGKKVSETNENGLRTTRWKAESPVWFPTVIFGDYLTAKPSIKATKSDGSAIDVNVWVDKISTSGAGLAGALPGEDVDRRGDEGIRGSQLKALGDQAVNALNLYREVYGVDYPFSKLDLVNAPFEPGAQAPDSIIYLASFLFRGEGVLALGGRTKADYFAKSAKDTVAHETAHQWWGSLVGSANQRNYWFVESLAEFSAALYDEAMYGRKRYLEKAAEWRKEFMEQSPAASVQNSSTIWGGDFSGDGALQSYISNVYCKGPYAFYTLRETFGDEKFFAFLKSLAKELRGKEIVTRDIQKIAEQSFGGNMDWFFDQWIRGVGIPQFSIHYSVRKSEDAKYIVEGKIKQRVTVGPDKAEVPGLLYRGLGKITFVFHNGKEFTYPKPLLVEKAETPFAMKLPEEPAEVLFNKHGEILAHDVLVNKSW